MLLQTCLISTFLIAIAAHGCITEVKGQNGIIGTALGIDDSVSRASAGRAAQTDTSVIRDRDVMTGQAGPCGKTKIAGVLKMDEEITKVAARNNGELPTITAGGDLEMTLHKINEDGGGPFFCDFTTDGEKFTPMQVTRNVPGFLGLGLGRVQNFPLTVKIPADVATCTAGPNKDTCMVRCRNAAVAGPFGGCAPVRLAGVTAAPEAAAETAETPAASSAPATEGAAAAIVADADATSAEVTPALVKRSDDDDESDDN
jgi:hypothetical protein